MAKPEKKDESLVYPLESIAPDLSGVNDNVCGSTLPTTTTPTPSHSECTAEEPVPGPATSVIQCKKCQEAEEKDFPWEGDSLYIKDIIVGEEVKVGKEKEEQFLNCINAFMNEGGGVICLHVEEPHILNQFEIQMNGKMADMIPDDTPFHENFERTIWDKNHVIFRVKPKSNMLSTCTFNTRIPYDSSTVKPTHGQMRYLSKQNNDEDGEEMHKNKYTFKKDQPVGVCIKSDKPRTSVFQEGVHIQAKSAMSFENKGKKEGKNSKAKTANASENNYVTCKDFEKKYFDKTKKKMYLPLYISAFSKVAHGGSIFLGISEKDGSFYCEGIKITQGEQDRLQMYVRNLVRDKMDWRPYRMDEASDLPDLVDVHSHPLLDSAEHVVVEIKVKRYAGMTFCTKDGPTAYCFGSFTEDGNFEPKKMTTEEWFEHFQTNV